MAIKRVPLYNIIYDDNGKPQLNEIKKAKCDSELCEANWAKLQLLRDAVSLDKLAYEQIYVISCDILERPKAFMCISSDEYNEANVAWRNVGMFLLLSGAEKALIVHNHPADVLVASDDDRLVSVKFITICSTFNIQSVGCYIVGRSGYFNIADGIVVEW